MTNLRKQNQQKKNARFLLVERDVSHRVGIASLSRTLAHDWPSACFAAAPLASDWLIVDIAVHGKRDFAIVSPLHVPNKNTQRSHTDGIKTYSFYVNLFYFDGWLTPPPPREGKLCLKLFF